MSYIKSTVIPTLHILLNEGEESDIENVYLGQIVTNYPETGESWEPEYSIDVYATIAGVHPTFPPENTVGLVESQYIYDYVNHYFGVARPK